MFELNPLLNWWLTPGVLHPPPRRRVGGRGADRDHGRSLGLEESGIEEEDKEEEEVE